MRVLAGCENFIHIKYKDREEKAGRNGNVCLASMTTSYARIALYKAIDKYQKVAKVVYYDTDSVFLLFPPGHPVPETSTVLGRLKDEIAEDFDSDHFISQFCALGPKSYCYTVVKGAEEQVVVKEVMKAKGFSPSFEASQKLFPERMWELVEGREEGDTVSIPQFQIRRDLAKLRLFNTRLQKSMGFSSSKGWFISDSPTLATLPYGYCE